MISVVGDDLPRLFVQIAELFGFAEHHTKHVCGRSEIVPDELTGSAHGFLDADRRFRVLLFARVHNALNAMRNGGLQ